MCAIVCRRNNPLEVNQFYPLSKNCPFEGLFLFHEKLIQVITSTTSYYMENIIQKFSATSLSNYVKNDPIIDFLDILKKEGCTINSDLSINIPEQTKKRKRAQSDEIIFSTALTPPKTSFDYIMENGNLYEKIIINKIKQQMAKNNELHLFHEIPTTNQSTQYEQTLNALTSNQYTIITGAYLFNKTNNTHGFPDLIVTGSWLNKYIKRLFTTVSPTNYYIIDIKSSTICLIQGQTEIASSALYDCYKMQVFIYSSALKEMLKTKKIETGFILGKRYKYNYINQTIFENDPFGQIGIIDFTGSNMKQLCEKAISWKKYLTNNWQNLSLNPISLNILPNMKNHYDKCYRQMKQRIAEENKEITLLWNCGYKHRNMAMSKGITRFDDNTLTPEIMGISKNSYIHLILSNMLKITNSDFMISLHKENNLFDWQNKAETEMFVDFETYDVEESFDELNDYHESLNTRRLYLIGVYDGNIYTCFLLKTTGTLTVYLPENHVIKWCNSEKDLLLNFIEFAEKAKRLIHWSSAETIIFNKIVNEHNICCSLLWFDLLNVFKHPTHPIIIKNCFSFGLKDVVKNLNKHNFIKLKWNDLDDGLLSAFLAKDIYVNGMGHDIMTKLVNYNFTDCYALFTILEFIRRHV